MEKKRRKEDGCEFGADTRSKMDKLYCEILKNRRYDKAILFLGLVSLAFALIKEFL